MSVYVFGMCVPSCLDSNHTRLYVPRMVWWLCRVLQSMASMSSTRLSSAETTQVMQTHLYGRKGCTAHFNRLELRYWTVSRRVPVKAVFRSWGLRRDDEFRASLCGNNMDQAATGFLMSWPLAYKVSTDDYQKISLPSLSVSCGESLAFLTFPYEPIKYQKCTKTSLVEDHPPPLQHRVAVTSADRTNARSNVVSCLSALRKLLRLPHQACTSCIGAKIGTGS